MEMMIEEIIRSLTAMKSVIGVNQLTIDEAIETMRKYQKIKEILKDDTYYEEYGNNAEKFIVSAISEVLKDGKID